MKLRIEGVGNIDKGRGDRKRERIIRRLMEKGKKLIIVRIR